jgi:hypothetical protein
MDYGARGTDYGFGVEIVIRIGIEPITTETGSEQDVKLF